MFRVLFLCTGNSGRSQMAAAIARNIAPKGIDIVGVGDRRYRLHDSALRVMKEIRNDIPERAEKSLKDIFTDPFDIVITLCNRAKEICPAFPGSPARIHWPLKDPGSEHGSRSIEAFRQIRDEINQRVYSLFRFGFLESIREMRLTFGTLLDNLTDGVLAHDVNRRIFFINEAAQRITGYSTEEVIGRDCHQVFAEKFCGGDCSFCDEKVLTKSRINYTRNFTKKNGEQISLEMTVVALDPPHNMVTGALVLFRDVSEVVHLRRRLEKTRGFHGIIGHHMSMVKVFDSIRELSDVTVPILIQGETGTGKEMVATALHLLSKRSSGPFVPVNCGALPEGTLESELFGHVKGAFTGAVRDRKGRFELAEGGTIFLDEIGEISTSMQVKLLRVLQDGCFTPVGGEKTIKVNSRVICATNRDLKLLTRQGLFREDLYFRLAVVPINMPSLQERKSDINLLVEYFLDKYSGDIGKKVREISPEALEILMNYNWPGNVRELSNAVQYGMIKCKNGSGILKKEHLPPEILEYSTGSRKLKAGRPSKILSESIRETLERTGGNKAKAAKLLNISRTTLYRVLKENNM